MDSGIPSKWAGARFRFIPSCSFRRSASVATDGGEGEVVRVGAGEEGFVEARELSLCARWWFVVVVVAVALEVGMAAAALMPDCAWGGRATVMVVQMGYVEVEDISQLAIYCRGSP